MMIRKFIVILIIAAVVPLAVGACVGAVDEDGYSESNPRPVLELVPPEAKNVVELVPGLAMFEVNGKCFLLDNTYNEPWLRNCDKYK